MITSVRRVKIRRDIKHKIQYMSRRYQDIKTFIYKTAKYLYSINKLSREMLLVIISKIYCETINAIERIPFLMNSSLARNLLTSSLYLYIFLQS